MPDNRKSTQTGIRIPDETLSKAKYIAWFERETFTDRLVTLLDADISKWEKKNGPITPEQISQSEKKKK
jgi:hypothetical protein